MNTYIDRERLQRVGERRMIRRIRHSFGSHDGKVALVLCSFYECPGNAVCLWHISAHSVCFTLSILSDLVLSTVRSISIRCSFFPVTRLERDLLVFHFSPLLPLFPISSVSNVVFSLSCFHTDRLGSPILATCSWECVLIICQCAGERDTLPVYVTEADCRYIHSRCSFQLVVFSLRLREWLFSWTTFLCM
jgi:hypothetical protein